MSDGRLQANTEAKTVPKTKKDLKYMRDKDREMVSTMAFSFRKYKEDEIETYTLNDGSIYTIPRGVAYHLSNNCWYPEHAYKMDEQGRPSVQVTKKKRRCSFEPLDFMDPNDLAELTPSNIETVSFLK